jgi:hypothetical protein
MAQSKVTSDALVQMAQLLNSSKELFESGKHEIDSQLEGIVWDDPVGWNFRSRYEEDFKSIVEKLIPNIEEFLIHLQELGVQVAEYSGDYSFLGSLGTAGFMAGASKIIFEPIKPSNGTVSGLNPFDPKKILPFHDDEFDKSLDGMSEKELEYKVQEYRDTLEKAQLAKYAYHDGDPLPAGWTDVTGEDQKIKQICDDIAQNGGNESGLKFSVLRKGDKYVVSFGGTDFGKEFSETYKDGKTDITGAFSPNERQSELSRKLVWNLVKDGGIPLDQIEFTGHSLGGRLAAENSVAWARPATTFNAAGSHPDTYRQYENMTGVTPGYRPSSNYTGVRNIVTEHDPLSHIQSFFSGSKNPYIDALPKKEITIAHETLSGTISSTPGKVMMTGLSAIAPPVAMGIQDSDKILSFANTVNEYYNRDYRAIGATLTLPDGLGGLNPLTSLEAHKITVVEDLLSQRLEMIEKRLGK